MSAPTATSPTPATAARPRRLRGLAWLLARQHRTAVITCAVLTVVGAAWILYERSAMLDALHATGRPVASSHTNDPAVHDRAADALSSFGDTLAFLPVLFGVLLGAPLISADREHGTARLVTTQSVPRGRWLRWKLCFALALAAVPTAVLSLLYSWWLESAGPLAPRNWLSGPEFETTGPVLVASALFCTALGIAIGAAARRSLPAMVATFLTAYTALLAAGPLRERLATPRTLAYPLGSAQPAALDHVVQVDQWIGTASGKLYGWGTCVHDSSPEGCRASLGIVNSVWEYFGPDQMAGMQWTAAGMFLGLTALLVGAVLRWTRHSAL